MEHADKKVCQGGYTIVKDKDKQGTDRHRREKRIVYEDFASALVEAYDHNPTDTDTIRERIAEYTSGTIAQEELGDADGTQAATAVRMCERFAGDLTHLIATLESLYVQPNTQARAVADALVSFSEMLGTLMIRQQE